MVKMRIDGSASLKPANITILTLGATDVCVFNSPAQWPVTQWFRSWLTDSVSTRPDGAFVDSHKKRIIRRVIMKISYHDIQASKRSI